MKQAASGNKLAPVEKLLLELLDIDSPSGSEGLLGEFLEKKLMGFKVSRQYVAPGRFNVTAQKGDSDIWICAHMDTVPTVVPVRLTQSRIYGRGSIDNKGNIAGAIVASRSLANMNLLLTVGEEVDFAGAKCASVRGRVVVLEPTGLVRVGSQCGVVAGRISTRGFRQHSSLPVGREGSATEKLVSILGELQRKQWHRFNIGTVSGGIAANVVADAASAEFSVRPRNQREFRGIVSALKKIRGVRVEIVAAADPYRTDITVPDLHVDPVDFFSELAFFRHGMLFGVGDIQHAHSTEEHVVRSQLRALPGKLAALVHDLENAR